MTQCPHCKRTIGFKQPDALCGTCEASERFHKLRKLCGYIESGEGTTVRIFQDDATKEWIVSTRDGFGSGKSYYGGSIQDAIDSIQAVDLED